MLFVLLSSLESAYSMDRRWQPPITSLTNKSCYPFPFCLSLNEALYMAVVRSIYSLIYKPKNVRYWTPRWGTFCLPNQWGPQEQKRSLYPGCVSWLERHSMFWYLPILRRIRTVGLITLLLEYLVLLVGLFGHNECFSYTLISAQYLEPIGQSLWRKTPRLSPMS